MTDTATGDVATELGYLRACIETAQVTPESFDLAVLLPRLGRALGAVEAALAAAGGWDETAVKLDAVAERASDDDDVARAVLISTRAQACQDCAATLREVISRALLGKAAEAAGGLRHHSIAGIPPCGAVPPFTTTANPGDVTCPGCRALLIRQAAAAVSRTIPPTPKETPDGP